MRGIRLKDEICPDKTNVKGCSNYILKVLKKFNLTHVSLLTENILSMCLKEAVNNVVKHSGAASCLVSIEQSREEIVMTIHDDGVFKGSTENADKGPRFDGNAGTTRIY